MFTRFGALREYGAAASDDETRVIQDTGAQKKERTFCSPQTQDGDGECVRRKAKLEEREDEQLRQRLLKRWRGQSGGGNTKPWRQQQWFFGGGDNFSFGAKQSCDRCHRPATKQPNYPVFTVCCTNEQRRTGGGISPQHLLISDSAASFMERRLEAWRTPDARHVSFLQTLLLALVLRADGVRELT